LNQNADDFAMGFQYRRQAEQFLKALQGRMQEFGLTLHHDKTRLLEFGRFAAENRKKRCQSQPETFDSLGILYPHPNVRFFACDYTSPGDGPHGRSGHNACRHRAEGSAGQTR
jgi:nucleoid DNA-binding protein